MLRASPVGSFRLLQWRYLPGRATRLDQFPVCKQLIPAQVKPFEDEKQRPLGEIPVNNPALDLNRNRVFAIHRMEMGRWVFSRENADHKTCDLRHGSMVAQAPES